MTTLVLLQTSLPATAILVRHDRDPHEFERLAAAYAEPLVWIHYQDADGTLVAEGVLVADRWVLTAAHVADGMTREAELVHRDETYAVGTVCVHPGWTGEFEELHDLALVELTAPVRDARPARLYRDGDEEGREIVFVGRGMGGTGLTGPEADDQVLRAATNRVAEVGPKHLAFTFEAPESPRATRLEGISGPGDSGGPAVLADGRELYVLGVSSAQDDAPTGGLPGRYGVLEYYSRVSAFADWIDSVLVGTGSCRGAPSAEAIDTDRRAVPADAVAAMAEILAAAPAASVAVIRGEEVLWRAAYGTADASTGDPATVDTRFLVWSVAKPWTATAAASLVERGMLDPEVPIASYLPELPSALGSLTVMQLATHRSGIRHYRNEAEAIRPGHCAVVADALPLFVNDPLVIDPGTAERYSTWGYVLLSAVIERACGERFSECLRDAVLEPAGMDGVRMAGSGGGVEAVGSEPTEDGFRPVAGLDASCKFGGGGLVATPLDLARFYAALLEGRLVGPEMRALILGDPADGIVRSGGTSAGGRSAVRADLATGLVVAITANTRAGNADFAGLADRIAGAFAPDRLGDP